MSGISFSEFFLLFLIGLIVLGPERLPKVANQLGRWVGQARRMTRVMKRQLEDELDFDEELNIKPQIHSLPRDDDTYSPRHGDGTPMVDSEETRNKGDDALADDEPDAVDDVEETNETMSNERREA